MFILVEVVDIKMHVWMSQHELMKKTDDDMKNSTLVYVSNCK